MSEGPTERLRRKGLNTVRHTSIFRLVNFELFARPVRFNLCYISIYTNVFQNKFVMTIGAVCMTGIIGYLIFLNLTSEEPRSSYKKVLTEDGYTTKKRTRWEN